MCFPEITEYTSMDNHASIPNHPLSILVKLVYLYKLPTLQASRLSALILFLHTSNMTSRTHHHQVFGLTYFIPVVYIMLKPYQKKKKQKKHTHEIPLCDIWIISFTPVKWVTRLMQHSHCDIQEWHTLQTKRKTRRDINRLTPKAYAKRKTRSHINS